MNEKKYLDADAAYDSGTLTDWYISSVDDSSPVWTDEHIDELMNDFYVIPRDTKSADVAPVVHGHWENKYERHYMFFGTCSVCKHVCQENNICGNCGAIMDEEAENV